MVQVRLDTQLVNDIRLIFRNEKTGGIPQSKQAVVLALKIIRDKFYQENGANVDMNRNLIKNRKPNF